MKMNRKAFSLVELILMTLFIGTIAMIAVPRLNYAIVSEYRAKGAAKKLVTDLRRVRGLAISEAANNTCGFSLNIISTPHGYEIRNLNDGTTLESHRFESEVTCAGGTRFEFGPLGNLKAGSDTQITVSGGGRTFTVTILSATGTVKCAES